MTEVWLFQTAFLGDCILSLPTVCHLVSDPSVQLTIVTSPAGKAAFELAQNRGLKFAASQIRIVVLDKKGEHASLWRSASWIKNLARDRPPELALCLQRSFRTAFLAYVSGAPVRVGFSTGSAAFLYTKLVKRDWHEGRPEIEKNLDLLRTINESTSIPVWDPKSAPSILAQNSPGSIKLKNDGPVVALSLGSPWPTKRWPVANASQLVEKLTAEGIRVKLLGDASAKSLGEELKKLCPSLLVDDLTGKTTIAEWVDAIASVDVLVSGDSAAVHVASDLKVPVLALFGPTLPEFGFAPWRENSLALGVQNLPCRPCHIHGPKVCPKVHFRCLKDLRGDQVYEYLKRLLTS